MTLTEVELQARIEAEEARWKQVAEQIQRQYDMERAAYMGRLGLLRELLINGNGDATDTPVENGG